MLAIRPATPDDAAAIAAVHVHAHREAYVGLLGGDYAGPTLASRLALWTSALPAGGGFVATDSGLVVGFGHAHEDRITTLYILASHHRRGIGRQLLACLLDHLQAQGHAQARFEVLAGNTGAMRFYEVCGAVQTGRAPLRDAPTDRPAEEVLYVIPTGPAAT